jgi:Zn-dependent protease
MTIPVPAGDRPGLVSFRVLGFPVTIHLSFVLVVLVLGYSAESGIPGAVVWLGVVTVSVIAHELGHAAVAAPAGGHPAIDLYGMAGLTRWDASRAGRGRQIAVSLAGPGAGLAFGVLVILARTAIDPTPGTLLQEALDGAVFANVAWGVLNLLPMLPLDGGHVVRALLPGDDVARARRAAWVSLVVAAAVAVAAMSYGAPIAAALVVFFAAGNVQTLQALHRAKHGPPPDRVAEAFAEAERAIVEGYPEAALQLLPPVDRVPYHHLVTATHLRAMALLRAGRARDAQDTMLGLPPHITVDRTFAATVLLANGQERLAREQLAMSLPDAPDWAVRELVALLRARGEDPDAVLAGLGRPSARD